MTIEQLIKQLQQFNPKAEVSINCPDTSDTRSIWYVDTDFGDKDNHVDIVMQKIEDDNPNKEVIASWDKFISDISKGKA